MDTASARVAFTFYCAAGRVLIGWGGMEGGRDWGNWYILMHRMGGDPDVLEAGIIDDDVLVADCVCYHGVWKRGTMAVSSAGRPDMENGHIRTYMCDDMWVVQL
jgi:hypothetical protein